MTAAQGFLGLLCLMYWMIAVDNPYDRSGPDRDGDRSHRGVQGQGRGGRVAGLWVRGFEHYRGEEGTRVLGRS